MGVDAAGCRQGDIAPDQAVEGIAGAGFVLDGGEEGRRFSEIGAGEAVEILQRQEGLDDVPGAGAEIFGKLLPVIADVEAGDLHAGEQRDGADLVLRVGRFDAPDLMVVSVEHGLLIAE